MQRPIRVLISKIGLDGHDRGAKLIARNLRDAGMEVIYTGLWQTPGATVHAAMQEDVDVLGISLLSAAHMTIVPEVLRLAREAGIGDVPVVVGGIIPEQDKQPLRIAGCSGVYNPGTPMATIVESITALATAYRDRMEKMPPIAALDSPPKIARAITWLCAERRDRLAELPKPNPKSLLIGVTGSPGVGKSTFIGRLARQLRERKRRVAVVAVDPTSPITGGSLLGDRLRMMRSDPDEGLFVRSLASSGMSGGLGPHTADVAALLTSAGYEIVLIETVGAGQNDVEIRKITQEVLLVLMPGAGDAVQFEKAGVIEIATGFVVNKADLPGTDHVVKDLHDTQTGNRPVWSVSSLRGEGLEAVCEWLEAKL
ncbi:MAG: cobalamin-dependent protein [Phycisphaerae bacterium]